MQCIIMEKHSNQIITHDETKKRARDSQIVRAKENFKLSHGGSSIRFDMLPFTQAPSISSQHFEVRKATRIGNRYNQVPHLSQDSPWESNKITKKKNITNTSQEVSPFPSGDPKAAMNRRQKMIHRRSTALKSIGERNLYLGSLHIKDRII